MSVLHKRVFEAQVEEQTLLAGARADPDGYGDARDDLQATGKVERPAGAGAYVAQFRPFGPALSNDGLEVTGGSLQQEIQPRMRQEYEALTQGIADAGSAQMIGLRCVRDAA